MMFWKTKYFLLTLITFALLLGASCNSHNEKAATTTKRTTVQKSNVETKGVSDSIVRKPAAEKALPQNTKSDSLALRIVREIPHDTHAYTQGLMFYKGYIYESTGQYGNSSLRKLDPQTGKVLKEIELANNYFAEGMTIFKDKIYQLTWRAGTGFVYDATTFRQLGTFSYYGEGWGLTSDGKNLIMSDGTNALRYIDPEKFVTVKTVFVVNENSFPLHYLNELEYINGEIWANVYMKNYIVRINPEEGRVVSTIDL